MNAEPELRQTLRGYQIFSIVISGVIGGGVFSNNGEALEVAGPAGLILSVVAIGVIAVFVSECISEFSQKFPAPNAIVEYVTTFVDEDLGWVVGLAYWYAFASVFAVQNLAAAELSKYWGLSQTFQTLAFYFLAPLVILLLNFCGVFYYGVVETIGGALKCALVFGVSILLYVFAAQQGDGSSSGPINDGFKNDYNFAKNHSQAVCYAIPLVAYSFLGIEIVAVTAFEAQYSHSLKWASRFIAYCVFLLYLLCTIGEILTVGWRDPHLPQIYGGLANSTTGAGFTAPPNSTSLAVTATWEAGYHTLAGFLNGCLIFSVLSASNTSLYVSSRTLYGLTREIPDSNWLGRKSKHLSIVVRQTGVPAPALLFSAVSFFWLPFLQLKRGYAIQDLIEIMAVSASVSCLIVWAALCVAFIRYQRWLHICDEGLKEQYQHYRRASVEYGSYTFLSIFQPGVAWCGLLGCILVFAFTSATWWSTPANFAKVAVAYAAHIILLGLFVSFKCINRRWWVKLSPDTSVLVAKLDRLRWLKKDQMPTQQDILMADMTAQAAVPKSTNEASDDSREDRTTVENAPNSDSLQFV